MDIEKYAIICKGKDKTYSIYSIKYNSSAQKYSITYSNSDKEYLYTLNSVVFLKNPIELNPTDIQICRGDECFGNIEKILLFKNSCGYSYIRVWYKNGKNACYSEKDLKISLSVLANKTAAKRMNYLRELSCYNELKDDNNEKILPRRYEKITFVSEKSVLANYLLPENAEFDVKTANNIIFPFGCNRSQYTATKNALENKMSVIEGPPGTGKTQTILNIISNLLIQHKTVLVVSNNNSAIENVLEKMNDEKYNIGFVAAMLGNNNNKKIFIENQSGEIPEMNGWDIDLKTAVRLNANIKKATDELLNIYDKQTEAARLKLALSEAKLEQKHYFVYSTSVDVISIGLRRNLKSNKIMNLLMSLDEKSCSEKGITAFYKFKSWIRYGMKFPRHYANIAAIKCALQLKYYETKIKELTKRITTIEEFLEKERAEKKQEELNEFSLKLLRNQIYKKYKRKEKRATFQLGDLFLRAKEFLKEYPVILSTTFSSIVSLNPNIIYDYVIMDEASQIDVTTGALALACAENVVVVGDSKQLKNVVTAQTKAETDPIFDKYEIPKYYRFSAHSFLSSICTAFPDIPRILLKEHYRCSYKIINYCNQKFYNNELIILTKDSDEDNAIVAYKTAAGKHSRGYTNHRQVDVIVNEVLKNTGSADVGVIAPYKDQVAMLKANLPKEIEVKTVHKFQGREKDTIIFSTVDDIVNDFSDDPNLLNVAISRAKKHFCIVVSDKEQPKQRNIADLISYIEYNNFDIINSKIHSVFDMLYKEYTKQRIDYLKNHLRISEYNSENLMYILVNDVISAHPTLNVICHYPLRMIVKDTSVLTEEERIFAMNTDSHLDFLIYETIGKKPFLAIEVDGVQHRKDQLQIIRDGKKNAILEKCNIPLLRFETDGSNEYEKLFKKVNELYVN
ncbi:MAG: AAA domain-containing protein [Christensenella sp.]